MYIQKAEIKNIRSIVDFEIEFKKPAGWHVLIGDNGAGKSTIIRSIALALIGENQAQGLRANWADWVNKSSLNKSEDLGSINLYFYRDLNFDKIETYSDSIDKLEPTSLGRDMSFYNISGIGVREFRRVYEDDSFTRGQFKKNIWNLSPQEKSGWFSAAYGPYRRFKGGSPEWNDLFKNPSYSSLAAHLSVFDESVALTEPINWLQDLNYKSLENNNKSQESQDILKNLKDLINSKDFLPHNTEFLTVNSENVFFSDGNNEMVSINQMSDGYRSVLSLTFELIRQLVRVYGSETVFKNIEKGDMFIDLPGVVLVDEIDAHLHPTWQTRIGQWFLKYFPKLQFIVTTHSPLVCRAAERGSIWRLAAPGSDEKSGEITGLDRDRLIYGNVLDAYGTEVFGTNVTISEESVKKQETLAKLSKKQMLDDISPEEEEKLEKLKKVFTTDAPIEL